MIAFGTTIHEPGPYRDYAEPGIRRAAEPDSEIYPFAAAGPLARTYNLMLEAAAAHDDLEALVLVNPHAEIADAGFCAKVRSALADPDVAIAGSAGATGVRSIAWWDGAVRVSGVVHRYEERGGGELSGFAWAGPDPTPGEVDAVDGFLLVLSPWTVRNLRFDEALTLGHGHNVDLCFQARAAGRKVTTAELSVIHHRALQMIGDLELWVEAHIQFARKWDGRIPGAPAPDRDSKRRTRHAEAEREAVRAIAYSNTLSSDARVLELERAMADATATLSWRVTEPLRRVNESRRVWRRRVAGRRG